MRDVPRPCSPCRPMWGTESYTFGAKIGSESESHAEGLASLHVMGIDSWREQVHAWQPATRYEARVSRAVSSA